MYFLKQIYGRSKRTTFFLQNQSSLMIPSLQISSKAQRIIVFFVYKSTVYLFSCYLWLTKPFCRQFETPQTRLCISRPISHYITKFLSFQTSNHLLFPLKRKQQKGVSPICSSSLFKVMRTIVPSGIACLNFWISDMIPIHVLVEMPLAQFFKLFWLPKEILSAASLMLTILKVWLLRVWMCCAAQARSQNLPNWSVMPKIYSFVWKIERSNLRRSEVVMLYYMYSSFMTDRKLKETLLILYYYNYLILIKRLKIKQVSKFFVERYQERLMTFVDCQYIQMSDRKAKLLKKYAGEVKVKKEHFSGQGLHIKDNEMQFNNDSRSSSSDQSESRQRKRIHSESEGQPEVEEKLIIIQQDKKSKRVQKGIRKALGLKKGEDAQQFLSAIKIQGLQMGQLEQYLKKNKDALKMQGKKQRKQRKKKEKEQSQKIKLQEEVQKSSSDLQIPEQARTIYRNKDGTIREFSKAKEKEMNQQKVLQRLGEWQKGMKKEQSSEQELIDIWDDPARRWQAKTKHPLRCPYQGYANRFNIKPGYRWDGVIRGNNFENKYLQQINLRKAKEQQQNREYMKNL